MVRLAAIEALGRIGDPSAVATLASTIKESPRFYWPSAHALGKIGSEEAVELLSKEIVGRRRPAPPLAPSEALAGCDHPRSARALLESFYQICVDPSAFVFVGDELRDRIFEGANDEYRRYGCGKSLAIVWSFRSTDGLLAILESGVDDRDNPAVRPPRRPGRSSGRVQRLETSAQEDPPQLERELKSLVSCLSSVKSWPPCRTWLRLGFRFENGG